MDSYEFTAIGTTWSITSDDGPITAAAATRLRTWLGTFENTFSRFITDSAVNQFREADAGTYTISNEFAKLLTVADQVRSFTAGAYDPAAAILLEQAGYDSTYSLTPQTEVSATAVPRWSLRGDQLTIGGPVTFDLGGIGKGYAIDEVAAQLKRHGYQHFLIDAGGDMFGTRKATGAGWRIAIEQPGKPDTAAGVVELTDQALAVSDTFRRRWRNWHHLIDARSKQPVQAMCGAAALAPTAWHADAMTSVLFFASPAEFAPAADAFSASYVCFETSGHCVTSRDWPGELFAEFKGDSDPAGESVTN